MMTPKVVFEPIKIARRKKGEVIHYSEEIVDKMCEYVEKCCDEGRMPMMEEFALLLGIGVSTLSTWCKEHPALLDEKDILMTVQKMELKRNFLVGNYVTKAASILLSADHDVIERTRNEFGGLNGEPVKIETRLSPEQQKLYSEEITKIFEKIYSGR
jgi:hypothetical protein